MKNIILISLTLLILSLQVNCGEKFAMFSKIDRNELKPSHMESLIKGSSFDPVKSDSKEKTVKSTKEHNKIIKKAREMEMEVDMSAGVAEGIVKATEEAFKSMGADQKKLDFFENIIEMVEEVKEAEDNYLELVQEHEIQRKMEDKKLKGLSTDEEEEEDDDEEEDYDDFENNQVFIIDLFEEGEEEEDEIIDIFGKNVNLDQVIDNDDEFFMQNSEDEEEQLRGSEILQQVENNMIIIEEELDELMGVAMEIEDEIDNQQNQENDQEEKQVLQILATLDEEFMNEDIFEDDQYEQDEVNNENIYEENDEFELDYLNKVKGINENAEELTQLNAEEQQKQQENLQKLEQLIQESQQRITADKIYGLLALGAGFSTIYICFFRNYQQKSEEEENRYNKYKQYAYLDEESNKNSQNDAQLQQNIGETPQNNDEDNELGMIDEEDDSNNNNNQETPQHDQNKKEHVKLNQQQKKQQQQDDDEEELKTLNNSVCKDGNDIDSQDQQNKTNKNVDEEDLV